MRWGMTYPAFRFDLARILFLKGIRLFLRSHRLPASNRYPRNSLRHYARIAGFAATIKAALHHTPAQAIKFSALGLSFLRLMPAGRRCNRKRRTNSGPSKSRKYRSKCLFFKQPQYQADCRILREAEIVNIPFFGALAGCSARRSERRVASHTSE